MTDTYQVFTIRQIIDTFRSVKMIDVVMPTTDGRVITLPRSVEPNPDLAILLNRLGLTLPAQPPPKISSEAAESAKTMCSEDLRTKPQQSLGFCPRTWEVGLTV